MSYHIKTLKILLMPLEPVLLVSYTTNDIRWGYALVKVRVEGESKHDKFMRLATARTQETITKIRILGNCANKDSYEYSEAETDKIIKAIEEEIRILKQKFRTGKSEKKAFSLVN